MTRYLLALALCLLLASSVNAGGSIVLYDEDYVFNHIDLNNLYTDKRIEAEIEKIPEAERQATYNRIQAEIIRAYQIVETKGDLK